MPLGPEWQHEIKHDGWRVIARREGGHVRLWSGNGRNWKTAFPEVATALMGLPPSSFLTDGEVVGHDEGGWPRFNSHRGSENNAVLYASERTEVRALRAALDWPGPVPPGGHATPRNAMPPHASFGLSLAEALDTHRQLEDQVARLIPECPREAFVSIIP
ncbi:MAG: hypothetical protein ABW003_07020 [Microvirga sp.]